ncbi:ferritin/ribonucleotide reductase-like protein [Moesziomyces antarcticus]|uniref:Ferritin/ribonucleotide reductase-like protein n=2 Tax=Pseudozyma antarctica TaxID=84753 RepID=A0A081CK46_PSEA2|nr:ferritin/ribonucleotide reductase-like protein [Moesziomyces antarcticus]GAK67042.1 ferritin/ribonucleotide reductase-like protein [Moesziomyces antarcticus]SPO48289.1 related to stress response protein rds1p [Moesziomyces antarcticus]
MLTKYAVLAAAAAAAVTAAPVVEKRAAPGQADIDTVILNYALTLEHLENAFYRDTLATYDAGAFRAAGYPDWVRQRFVEIGGHEKAHVDFLSKALGDQATKECTYNFGITDVKTFVATSALLEGIGNSAYLGAAQNITNVAYLTAAGSILTVEARHASWVASSVQQGDGFPAGFDTPLNFNQTYSLAAPLITSCPDSNPALPVKAFPAATISGDVCGGKQVTISGDGVQSGQFAAFLTGLNVYYAPIGDNGSVTVPSEVAYGRVYVVVTKSGDSVSDDNTVAGPAVVDIPLSAEKAEQIYSQQ